MLGLETNKKQTSLERRQSPGANKSTDTTLLSAFENTIQIDEIKKILSK